MGELEDFPRRRTHRRGPDTEIVAILRSRGKLARAEWFERALPEVVDVGKSRVSDESPHKVNAKKQGKTLKEKQAAKKTKRILRAGKASNIPPTGH